MLHLLGSLEISASDVPLPSHSVSRWMSKNEKPHLFVEFETADAGVAAARHSQTGWHVVLLHSTHPIFYRYLALRKQKSLDHWKPEDYITTPKPPRKNVATNSSPVPALLERLTNSPSKLSSASFAPGTFTTTNSLLISLANSTQAQSNGRSFASYGGELSIVHR